MWDWVFFSLLQGNLSSFSFLNYRFVARGFREAIESQRLVPCREMCAGGVSGGVSEGVSRGVSGGFSGGVSGVGQVKNNKIMPIADSPLPRAPVLTGVPGQVKKNQIMLIAYSR